MKAGESKELGLGDKGELTGQKGAEAWPEQSPTPLANSRPAGSHSPLGAGTQVNAGLGLCTADGSAD